ncbi:MAG: hypothetical protein J4N75_07180 [Chloroflexi bacterium]|nr:hypothetical protein [Chloroflexota bacterium]MCI0901046.1 hypothetical protein [Chloroflexota bacterium]MCI0903265.1 hypothetical protein [Chloroflexota bacterium]
MTNQNFSVVTAGEQTECFQGALTGQGGQTPAPFSGRLLAALDSNTKMLAEHQAGGCAGSPAFFDPVAYRK